MNMATYRAFAVAVPGNPLEQLTFSLQSTVDGLPADGVMVKIHASGVCHTDIHLWRGYFQIGRRKDEIIRFSDRGMTYPKVPGHEIAGSVYAVGERSGGDADLKLGDRILVYPWIGCDECYLCKAGDSHLCSKSRELGFVKDGGYAEFAVVPHYRYIFKIPDNISYPVASMLPCSGITTYSAVKKILPVVKRVRGWGTEVLVTVIGLGGLGLWALNLLKYCLDADDVQHVKVVGVDISKEKLDHALESKLIYEGFEINSEATDEPSSAGSKESERFLAQFGKVHAVLNFVCSSESFDFSVSVLHKGGVLVLTGLFGGLGELKLPMTALNELTVTGNYVGSLSTLDELLCLMSKHSIPAPPVTLYKLEEASKALSDLEKGLVVGRIILCPCDN